MDDETRGGELIDLDRERARRGLHRPFVGPKILPSLQAQGPQNLPPRHMSPEEHQQRIERRAREFGGWLATVLARCPHPEAERVDAEATYFIHRVKIDPASMRTAGFRVLRGGLAIPHGPMPATLKELLTGWECELTERWGHPRMPCFEQTAGQTLHDVATVIGVRGTTASTYMSNGVMMRSTRPEGEEIECVFLGHVTTL